ncbi:GNAT family N-acetyltransferase [Microbacterium sp. J1-1]|uniref:GNAT family N-acetyltransferase n=1 Tax=Microbacterium sp. J1-1 TaxID=2992441 RepID=UPI0021146983|nr:GNAT family N-acetyltransferase [Microbacterium sp. J1-1]UUE20689.1 GNAT family N-acetyltransferase [Microbacterium sp. J1-1]
MSEPRETIRRLRADEPGLVLRLLDEAVEWFVSIGNTGQWGAEPFSSRPAAVERAQKWCEEDEGWVLERDARAVAVLVLGDRTDYVPAVDEPELYVRLLVGSRRARGAGARLLQHAVLRAEQRGVPLLRVDCYAGGTGDLVRYYEAHGFVRQEELDVRGWPCQVLGRRLMPESASRR